MRSNVCWSTIRIAQTREIVRSRKPKFAVALPYSDLKGKAYCNASITKAEIMGLKRGPLDLSGFAPAFLATRPQVCATVQTFFCRSPGHKSILVFKMTPKRRPFLPPNAAKVLENRFVEGNPLPTRITK